ncbi:MAG: serine hydrolase [Saprospiraceae bacterium]|nr:serine hydrolase [Saprospiraceae bacterium]
MRLVLLLLFSLSILNLSAQKISPKKLEQQIRQEFARSPGTFAIAFRDLSGKKKDIFINEKENFHAASTMKTPVLLEVYKQAAAGKFRLDDSLIVKNEFKSIVDGSPYSLSETDDSELDLYKKIGQKESIYDLCYKMIILSSNLATNIVIELVDAKNVTQTMRDLGAKDIQVRRGVEDGKAYRQGLNNTTTAYDLMLLFEKMGKEELVSPEACEAMIDILLDQKFNEMIPAQLPTAVKVAHKTGWITSVRHDSGLVLLPDGRKYVLVLLSKGWESDELATEIMSNISKIVYQYYASSQ